MSVQAHFVAAVGRVSLSDVSARPKIEAIVAKHGGRMVPGGIGNSHDPIKSDFGDNKAGAQAAAAEAWYLDDVESAYVRDVETGAEAAGPSANAVKESVEEGDSILTDALDAVNEGEDVKEVVDALLEGKKVTRKGKKDNDDMCEATNRWGHKLAIGAAVKVAEGAGSYADEVAGFEKGAEGAHQVKLKSGKTAGINDVIPA